MHGQQGPAPSHRPGPPEGAIVVVSETAGQSQGEWPPPGKPPVGMVGPFAMGQALDAARRGQLLAVVLGPGLDQDDALALLRQWRGVEHTLPVVAVLADAADADQAMRLGAQGCLPLAGITWTAMDVAARAAAWRGRGLAGPNASVRMARAIIDSSLDIIVAVDKDRHIVEFNPAAERAFGYKRSEAVGRHVDLLYAEPAKGVEVHNEVVTRGTARVEVLNRRKDGSKFVSLLSSAVLRGPNGELLGLVGVSRDITDKKTLEREVEEAWRGLEGLIDEQPEDAGMPQRVLRGIVERHKEAQMELRRSDTLKRALLNSPTTSAVLLDRQGLVLEINEVGARRMGKAPEQVRGRFYGDFLPREVAASRLAKVEACLASGRPQDFEDEYEGHAYGHTVYPAHDHQDRTWGVAIFGQDITERREAEKALARQQEAMAAQAFSLAEANTALKVLLEHRADQRRALEENVLVNVRRLVEPYLERIEAGRLSQEQKTLLDIARNNLEEITGPLARRWISGAVGLTPRELEVANLVREGRTTCEIAQVLCVSEQAVAFHRKNIRKKLGLAKRRVNLRAFLQRGSFDKPA